MQNGAYWRQLGVKSAVEVLFLGHWGRATLQGMTCSVPLTQACEDRDFVEWHRGCPWCAVWVLWPEDAALLAQVQRARAHLAEKLLPHYQRQPHITVAYRGLVSDGQPHPAQEYGWAQLQADVQALAQVQVPALHVRVQGVGSFDTVPYLQVQGQTPEDAAHLQQLHDALTPHEARWPQWRYVPHVTLGHYAGVWPQSEVVQALQQVVHEASAQVLHLERLWLMRYASHDVAGALVPEGYWDLQQQRYVRHAGALIR